jgi:fatty-acyl-CoA synthase
MKKMSLIPQNKIIATSVDEKLSYISATSNATLTYKTIGEQLFEMADKFPDNVVLIFHKNDGMKLTYSDLKDRAVRLAKNLLHIGLKKGDRIAFLLPNTYELAISYLAGALIGLTLVPLDQDYGSVELEFMIKKTDPTAMVANNSDEFEETVNELLPNIYNCKKGEYANERFPSLKHLIFLNETEEIKKSKNVWSWSELADGVVNDEQKTLMFPRIEPEELPFVIMFTVSLIFIFRLKKF